MMKVKELIEKLKDYPEAEVCISMEGVFTNDCYLSQWSETSVLISEKGL